MPKLRDRRGGGGAGAGGLKQKDASQAPLLHR